MPSKETLIVLGNQDHIIPPEFQTGPDDTPERFEQVDQMIPRVSPESLVDENGIIPLGCVDTGIRANDGLRYLHIDVSGYEIGVVKRYLELLRDGKVNESNLKQIKPDKSTVFDPIPYDAQPRIDLI